MHHLGQIDEIAIKESLGSYVVKFKIRRHSNGLKKPAIGGNVTWPTLKL